MKPFDLEKAKAGAPIITRSGLTDFKFVAHEPEAIESSRLIILRKSTGGIHAYPENGVFLHEAPSELDLFMAEEPPVVKWLWATKHGFSMTRCFYSEEEALQNPEFPVKLEWTRTEFPADGGA